MKKILIIMAVAYALLGIAHTLSARRRRGRWSVVDVLVALGWPALALAGLVVRVRDWRSR